MEGVRHGMIMVGILYILVYFAACSSAGGKVCFGYEEHNGALETKTYKTSDIKK